MKKLFNNSFKTFYFFYKYLGSRIFISVVLSICVGVLDGFGLAMFLPLLQMVNNQKSINADGMGNLQFLIEICKSFNVQLTIVTVLIFMFLFFVIKGVFNYFSSTYSVVLQQDVVRKIRYNLLQSFNNLKFETYISTEVGRIQNALTGEVERISRAFSSYFLAFRMLILSLVYISFAFFVDATFALMVSIGGVITNVLFKIIYKSTKRASKSFTDESNSYQGQIIEYVSNFKYLKATSRVSVFSLIIESSIDLIEKSRKKIGYLTSIVTAAREPLLIAVVAIVLIIQIKVLGSPLGPILISLLFFYRALTSVLGMQTAWNYYLETSGSMDNIQEFQNLLNDNFQSNGDIDLSNSINIISFNQVYFKFSTSKNILSNINIKINKNDSVAFVGESGSGKTTLINLITGLLSPTEGYIAVNDQKLNNLNLSSFQNRIGYITQEPVIFNDTIFNNITFWHPKNKQNITKFDEAVNRASLREFISQSENGFDTLLESNGMNLSGGQKQRISIAREFYKDIDILILDEATSALDSETEYIIQKSINELKGKVTIITVAHRLSTIRNVDKIYLLSEGIIESEGSFEELYKNNIKFQKMVDLQEV